MRNGASAPSFTGQLLFADLDHDSIVLDCILSLAGPGCPGSPVTLRADWPADALTDDVTSLLRHWADDAVVIDVTITDGPKGPAVEITSETTKVLLVPGN